MKKIKVLYFIDRFLLGGIQALVYDIIRFKDDTKIDIEILQLDDGVVYPMEQTFREMGVTIHQLKGVWMRTPLDFPKYFKAVDSFFAVHHDYDAIHIHTGSKNYYLLKCAKKYNIPIRVAHSHNMGFQSKNPLTILMGNLMKPLLKKYATHLCGCSVEACEWLFGKGCVEKNEAHVFLNGIDTTLFAYNEKDRTDIRDEFSLQDKFVLSNVGRFEAQKNHDFLIDIFAEVSKRCSNAILLLVGIGSLEKQIKQKVDALGIKDKVVFAGFRSDRYRFLSASDLFVLTSKYEGLGIVLIEAQAAGLPLFVSKGLPKDLEVLPDIKYISLNDSVEVWADAILARKDEPRQDMQLQVSEAGFDIRTMIENLYNMYTQK